MELSSALSAKTLGHGSNNSLVSVVIAIVGQESLISLTID